jgi:hypothetical protein
MSGQVMGQVVNLRTARKRAQRREADGRASQNRLKHGQSKAELKLAVARAAKDGRDLEGHRLEVGDHE